MLVGTNADPVHGFLPSDIVQSGVWLTRFPLSLGIDYGPYIAGLLDAQIRPVPVIHGDSFTATERRSRSYIDRLRWWAQGIPNPQYIQIGNEPDQPGSGSSWYMPRDTYYRLLRNARSVWPNTTIVAAGLVHVDFSYLDGVPADIVAVHPYTQDASTVGALIEECRKHTDLPLWCTEVGVPKDFYPTVHERAQWHTDMLVALWNLDIEAALQFPWAPIMNDSFDGMVDGAGDATEIYAAVSSAIEPLINPPTDDSFADRLFAGIQDAVGLPYVFGGRAVPPQAGFDCAGFVMEAYYRQGINTCYVPGQANPYPDYSYGKWYTNAQRLLDNPKFSVPETPEKGDLIFFTRTYPTADRATHIALVEDDDTFLGAQQQVAGSIRWTGSSYWTSRLLGFRRVPH